MSVVVTPPATIARQDVAASRASSRLTPSEREPSIKFRQFHSRSIKTARVVESHIPRGRSFSKMEGRLFPTLASAIDVASMTPRDCMWLVKPVDRSPDRSPQAVHSVLAARFVGQEVVEIGTHGGDGMNCFARFAKSAVAIEVRAAAASPPPRCRYHQTAAAAPPPPHRHPRR